MTRYTPRSITDPRKQAASQAGLRVEYHYIVTLQYHSGRRTKIVGTVDGTITAGSRVTRESLYDQIVDSVCRELGIRNDTTGVAVLFFAVEPNRLETP